ncbi:MAG: DUF2156 domain-containing protein [Clostridia bacterium]|nr:DUF2156 domain-containing protein [Clostridia bacterium]
MSVLKEAEKISEIATLKFRPLTINDKALYEKYLFSDATRGCELSFSNLISWGRHELAECGDFCVLYSFYGKYSFYPYPVGCGDAFPVIEAIIKDAKSRGITPIISGILPEKLEQFLEVYGERVELESKLGSFDYVYDINDLSTLSGKKYHKKRNHLNNFKKKFPSYQIEEITPENLHRVREMSERWYIEKQKADPENDITYERNALARALDNFEALKLDGIMITNGEKVLAFTMGSRLSRDTYDVQFEKAAPEAYSAINYEFANYIKNKYLDIKFLDREEDMGVLGLRKAKSSYYPHHMTEKYRAFFREDK